MSAITLPHAKIDCGNEIKQYSSKFTLDLSVLDKFKVALGLDHQKLVEISEHGFIALRNLQTYCRLYNADPAFTLAEYLKRIDESQAYLNKVDELSARASLGDHQHQPAPTQTTSWGGSVDLSELDLPPFSELPSAKKILSELDGLGKLLKEVKDIRLAATP